MKKILLSLMLLMAGFGISAFEGPDAYATVTSTTSQIVYAGNGVTSAFSFPFNVFNSSSENDLVVTKIVVTTGVETVLTINTNYTVTLTHRTPSPGIVTLSAGALPVGTSLLIQRVMPLTQQVSIADNSPTPAATTNAVYDRAIMISQQLQAQINLGVLQNPLATDSLTMPTAVAGQCIGWAGDGTLTNLGCSGSSGGGGGSAFNPPIADSQLQPITTASKVNGSSIYNLSSTPSGAGLLPSANLNLGTSASQIVQLTAAAKYPAVDGSLITNISGANLVSLASTPSGSGIIPIANLASGTPTGSKFIRDDGTLAAVTAASNITVYTSGSGNFVAPSGITKVYVSMIGGGGGGAGANSSSAACGGGGGSGAYVINQAFTVVPASSYAYVVGDGGAGGVGLANGSNGVASSFNAFSVAGGSGGVNATAACNGGSGGVGGGNSGAVTVVSSANSALGLSGLNGFKGDIPSNYGGTGAASIFGSTTGNSGRNTTGNAGTANTGVGGGGCWDSGGTNRTGGAGASGIVIVMY